MNEETFNFNATSSEYSVRKEKDSYKIHNRDNMDSAEQENVQQFYFPGQISGIVRNIL